MKILEEKQNPLFPRKEILAELESETSPQESEVIEALATLTKSVPESIKIRNILGKFGTNLFKVNAFIYSSPEDKNKIEMKTKKEKEAEAKAAAEAAEAAKKAKEEAAKAEQEAQSKESEEKTETPLEENKIEETK